MSWLDVVQKNMQPTSRWARMSVDEMSIQQKVLCALNTGNLTDQELERTLKMSGNSIRPARGACVKEGWVAPTGDTRKTPSGRLANVWELTVAGRAEVARILG